MNVAIVIPIDGPNVISGNWTKHCVVLSIPQKCKKIREYFGDKRALSKLYRENDWLMEYI